jgi:hypothetical protein
VQFTLKSHRSIKDVSPLQEYNIKKNDLDEVKSQSSWAKYLKRDEMQSNKDHNKSSYSFLSQSRLLGSPNSEQVYNSYKRSVLNHTSLNLADTGLSPSA